MTSGKIQARAAGLSDIDFMHRLGYREVHRPQIFNCIRNAEPLQLRVYYFQNEKRQKVAYYTEAVCISTGYLRHTTLFLFGQIEDHLRLHHLCLYTLFFDERIAGMFEEENRSSPPGHLDTVQTEKFKDWVRFYWNTNHFKENYARLGGLEHTRQLLFVDGKR